MSRVWLRHVKAPSGDNSVIGVLFVVRKTESEMNLRKTSKRVDECSMAVESAEGCSIPES